MSDTITEQSGDYRITVSRDDFSKMTSLLKIFENICTDCDIQNGMLRCRSNDRQAVVGMDLTSVIENKNLSFGLIKSKVALLKTFELDDNVQIEDKNIIIECNESNYEFSDPFSRMIFRKPVRKYIDNKFIADQDFSQLIRCQEENLIFSYDINFYMKKRISNISLGFQTDVIECKMSGFEAALKISTTNKEDNSDIGTGIVLNREIDDKKFKMISLPFTLDIASDMKFNCYSVTSDVYLCKFDMTYYGVPITIYTQVKVTNI